jgi:iron complex outermembrane receptor protein
VRIATSCAVYALGAIAVMGAPVAARAQAAAGTAPAAGPQNATQLTEIVVTAQKRSQSISNVGMAITAATGVQLKVQGVNGVGGLAKIDSSFVVSNTNYGAPVYSIRGISYNDFSLAATPTVSIYSDEVPYAYPELTKGAPYDLERVEVLKGPQGTLYGQNSTGGAINYISAKPTHSFAAGVEGTYGSYNAANLNGYISGPLSGTLAARLAFDVDEGGAWQKSDTRDATLGDKDTQRARLLLDWTPTDKLTVSANLNGWIDHSDTQTGQVINFNPSLKAYLPDLPQLNTAITNNELTPHNPRATDWLAGTHPKNDENYGQFGVRADYRISDALVLTYLGSYEAYQQSDLTEPGGINYEFSLLQAGSVYSDSQEVRLSGNLYDKKVIWLLGASYEENITNENQYEDLSGSTASYGLASYLATEHQPIGPYTATRQISTDDSKSMAGFGNVEYHPTDSLDFHAGVRFTQTDINHGGCSEDVGGVADPGINAEEMVLIAKANATPGVHDTFVPVTPNGCTTFGPTLNPTYYRGKLDQNNVSWRVGADWHPVEGTLAYVTVSQGYKAGSFPTLSATSTDQLAPVTQEALLAYELGVKSRFLENRLEVDGDVFYYDYSNKQLEGRIPDAIYGALNVLVNIPKSMEDGVELAVKARPIKGLMVTLQGTYLNSEVQGSTPGYTAFGTATNFEGESFPDTPRYAALVDVQYSWDLNDRFSAFVGANDRYRSAAQSQLGTYFSPYAPYPSTVINGYSLLGLRAGILSNDGHWRIQAFGDNVTNTYYVTHVEKVSDTTARFVGMPATYGLTVAYKY